MTNVTDIRCPNCDNPKADTLAIIGRGKKRTVLYSCLRCNRSFEMNPKVNNNFRHFFTEEQYEDAMNNA